MQNKIYLSPAQKNNMIHRLKITKGHLGKVKNMVESNEECLTINHQTRAVRFALKKVDQILLEEYLVYSLGSANKSEGLQQEINKTISMLYKIDG